MDKKRGIPTSVFASSGALTIIYSADKNNNTITLFKRIELARESFLHGDGASGLAVQALSMGVW